MRLDHAALDHDGGPKALPEAHFDVSAGEFRCIVSADDGARRALVDLVSLARLPTRGRIALFGRDAAAASPAERAALRRRIGVIGGGDDLLEHLSICENVALPLRFAGRAAAARRDVGELLSWLGLGDRLDAKPSALSRPERRLVAVARAVVARPELIVAEDPTSGIDGRIGARLLVLLQELNRHGTTVVVTTANPELAAHVGGPVLRLSGRQAADGDAAAPGEPAVPSYPRRSRPGGVTVWFAALLVYGAVLALAGLLTAGGTAGPDAAVLAGTVSIQIPASADPAADATALQKALDLVRTDPDVASAEIVPEARVRALVEPWLGDAGGLGDLPLPLVIDVVPRSPADADMAELSALVRAAVPQAVVDHHHGTGAAASSSWPRSLSVAAGLTVVVVAATVVTSAVTARAGLAADGRSVEILHRLGAPASYMARPATVRSFIGALCGGVAGAAAAVLTLAGLGLVDLGRGDAGLPVSPAALAAVAAVPVVVAALAALTTWIAVLRTLARLP